jgi:hypothetical protein
MEATKTVAHTPGPWLAGTGLDDCQNLGVYMRDDDGTHGPQIAEVLSETVELEGSDFEARMFADARLIAAAPELLEALRSASMQFEHNGDECPEDRAVLDQMQAAIARATGTA